VKTLTGIKRLLDIDQLLIFFLLIVTINQMGYYLASFAPPGFGFVGYLQAIAVDLAIWRSAWWYRRYRGKKQRRWALVGVVSFALVSAAYNFGFYTLQRPAMSLWQRSLMAAVLPAGVALLSYLKGQKDESKFGVRDDERAISEPAAKPKQAVSLNSRLVCDSCERVFAWPTTYSDQRAAQNAMNAHRCENERKEPEHELYTES